MKKYSGEIKSLDDLGEVMKSAQSNPIKLSKSAFQYYRGHGSSTYKLTSYASRFFKDKIKMIEDEKLFISDFKRRIYECDKEEYIYVPEKSNEFNEDWYWLTQAQHLGMPTRFLDWSLSGEVALYFAVSTENETKEDGDFWVFFIPDNLNIKCQQSLSAITALETKQDYFVNIPVQWNVNFEKNEPQRNMLSQQGKFFLRPVDTSLTPLEEEPDYDKYLLRYRVPAEFKGKILNDLKELNYTKENIYKTTDKTMEDIVSELTKTYKQK